MFQFVKKLENFLIPDEYPDLLIFACTWFMLGLALIIYQSKWRYIT